MYDVQVDGTTELLDKVSAHRDADAPRHVIPSLTSPTIYSVSFSRSSFTFLHHIIDFEPVIGDGT